MGAKHVAAVIRNWGQLDHRPFRLLMCMAHTALDEANPPLYYGGREMSAGFLGYTLEDDAAQKNAYRAVQKTISQLVDAGAITRVSSPSKISHARYAVNVNGPNGTPSGSPVAVLTGDPQNHPIRSQQVTLRDAIGCPSGTPTGDPQGRNGGPSGSPIGERGTELEEQEDEAQSPLPLSPPPRTTPSEFDEFWAEYPRRVGKDAARRAYTRARKTVTHHEILSGVRAFVPTLTGKDPKFIPHPATWLNAGRWADELMPTATADEQRPAIPEHLRWANEPLKVALDETGLFPWERN